MKKISILLILGLLCTSINMNADAASSQKDESELNSGTMGKASSEADTWYEEELKSNYEQAEASEASGQIESAVGEVRMLVTKHHGEVILPMTGANLI